MSAVLEARIAALERQVAALLNRRSTPFSLARSTLAVNDFGAVQTVQAQLDPLSVRDGIPLLSNFGHTSAPPIGADFHVAFIDGDRSKAVIIASGHQAYRLRGLGDGDSAIYDSRGAYAWLTPDGPAINGVGKPTLVTGDLHVTGNVYGGWNGPDQVGLTSHRHGTGTAASGTVPPSAGT
jgi:phage gp45-like